MYFGSGTPSQLSTVSRFLAEVTCKRRKHHKTEKEEEKEQVETRARREKKERKGRLNK
jgi:hypothetical protein